MKLGFQESAAAYESGSQKARILTESWAGSQAYCPNCGAEQFRRFKNNSPVADLQCGECEEEFELKSQKTKFGNRVVDGAYRTMIERLSARNNPNLLLLNYNVDLGVSNLFVVPKQFFVTDIIEERKPLSASACRAGWVGCNILLSKIPESGKIHIVRDGSLCDRDAVMSQWRRTKFLQVQSEGSRGWLLNVLKCVEQIRTREFSLDQVYAFEGRLSGLYPMNKHVRHKIRQQLQILRDNGLLEFLGRGRYRRS